ncbi:MAG: indolepyruvate ferredoxin oxidoreductase subunit alpha [Desulfovibrio sp.]|jgi:indolepyruvate ferredoxin oxidoreductase alpha subunit|nr:indolepyruvate ferredoxin oxidoreductase subunit alpha [Desulfovibrio sp.]
MNHPLLAAGGAQLLLGNEAIVRGALEAGVNFVTCYPGTPSSEVPDTFRRLAPSGRFSLEYAVNEKVALETAAGAALAGALCLVTMKHVGVNVAADPLLTMTYTGLPGGLVLMSADDPGCHSSQNEQDNRAYARFAGLPCFEPATAQECKDMTRAACLLARETRQPVMLRTTTRVSHLRGPVRFGPLPEPAAIVPFERNPRRFVPVPAVARVRHRALVEALEAVRSEAERSPFNKTGGSGEIGVVASGVSRAYLHDVLLEKGWENAVRVFDLGMSWPLPEKALEIFMRQVKTLLVLEEGEALVEQALNAMAHKLSLPVTIHGKQGPLSVFGEYSTLLIHDALAPLLDKNEPIACGPGCMELPQRPPNLCPGCAHRSVFYATRKLFGDDAYYSSDIGCYTLGLLPPLATADFLFCMGSSISAGSGFARASHKLTVAFIGDSTFFHSGITGLVNAVFNKHNILVVILDNGTTAMTGHQPNPGVDQEVLGDACAQLDIEAVVKGCGVSRVAKARGYNQKAVQELLLSMKDETGVRVLIVEEPCVLYARRTLKKARSQKAYVAAQDESVRVCLETLACPAFRCRSDGDGGVSVDPELCAGCMVCMQLSPSFKAGKGGEQ